jgi:NAD(P)-dependent dehydrogenase (short-subunit alcohol dehydrogenase family)
VGMMQPLAEVTARRIDVQLGLDLRTPILLQRECLDLLEAAAADRGWALVVNVASAAGRDGQAQFSVYSAAKAGLIAFTQAMHRELGGRGIRCTAVVPGTVDTGLTQYLDVDRDRLIPVQAVAEAVRMLLRVSPGCRVPELVLERRDPPD